MLPVQGNESWIALPLQEIIARREDLPTLALQAWDVEHTTKYLTSRGMDTALASNLVDITSGRPGFIAELADWAAEDEDFGCAASWGGRTCESSREQNRTDTTPPSPVV